MKRTLIVASTLAALAACAALAVKVTGSSGGEIPLHTVKKGAFVRRVAAEGNLKAVKATPIVVPGNDMSFKIAWLVDDGTRVKKGDVLVRFDPTETEKNLALGQGERATAQHKITKQRSESSATLTNLDRDAGQYRAELESAKTFQSRDPELFSRNEIIEADIDVDLASEKEAKAHEERGVRETLSRTSLDLLAIDSHKADLKVERAEKERAALEVVAPHDGLVVFNRDWRNELPQVGQSVWSGFALAQIPELSTMEAEIWVLEADAGGLKAGMQAKVVVESDPGREWPASVRRVDALPKPRIRGVPVQYFGAALDLAQTDPSVMKPGQRVRATLVLGDEKDALTLPRQAVFQKDGKALVYRRKDKAFEPVEVTLGATALGRVAVEKGLSDGDVVALRNPAEKPEEKKDTSGGAPASAMSLR